MKLIILPLLVLGLPAATAGAAAERSLRPAPDWIVLFDGRARVARLDGARAALGHVGLQNHDPGSRVSFRRIHARPLR